MSTNEDVPAVEQPASQPAAASGEQPTQPTSGTVDNTLDAVTANRTRSRQRALEYQTQSLRCADPFEACLGSQTATQIRLTIALEERIDTMLSTAAPDESPLQLDRFLKYYVQLAREVSHHAGWKLRLAERQRSSESAEDPLAEILRRRFAPPPEPPAADAEGPSAYELFR